MSKNTTEMDDFDFGFTSASEDEIVAPIVVNNNEIEVKYQKIIDKMLKAINPLLNNLAKDADTKDYIHWPNRKQKIEEFKNKLNKIAGK